MSRWERRKKRARALTRQSVTMDEESWRLIWAVAEAQDLGGKGFSAALRKILREWKELQDRNQAQIEQRPGEPGTGDAAAADQEDS